MTATNKRKENNQTKDKAEVQEKNEYMVEVIRKDKDGKELGRGKCHAYTVTQAGYELALKRWGLKRIMTDFNRQLKTDYGNDLARKKSVNAQVKAKRKTNTAFDAKMRALEVEYGIK